MRSIFDAYDEEFTAVTGEISRQISHVRAYEEDDRTRQNILRSLDGQLGQALDLMKQMEVEVRSTENPHEKCTLHDRVLLYKKTMLSLRGDFQEVLELEQKRGLMQGAGNRSPPSSLNQFQQARMEQTGQQLDEQSRMLEDGKGMVFEMEEVANDITQELGRNRETIKSAHRKVRDECKYIVFNCVGRDFLIRFKKNGWNFLFIISVVVVGLLWLEGGPFR